MSELQKTNRTVRVGVVIEVPFETSAETDEDFAREIVESKDVSDALGALVGGALYLKDTNVRAAKWPAYFSRFVVMINTEDDIKGLVDGLWGKLDG